MHSYTVDGLPTLKIQTLKQDSIQEQHRRAQTLPASFHNRIGTGHKSENTNLTAPNVNYAQVSLEEEHVDEITSKIPSNMTFKPVLIWKPRRKKSSPSRSSSESKNTKLGSEQPTAEANHVDNTKKTCVSHVDTTKKTCIDTLTTAECKPTSNEPRKLSMTVCKTNLTDTILPNKEAQQAKVRVYFGIENPRKYKP